MNSIGPSHDGDYISNPNLQNIQGNNTPSNINKSDTQIKAELNELKEKENKLDNLIKEKVKKIQELIINGPESMTQADKDLAIKLYDEIKQHVHDLGTLQDAVTATQQSCSVDDGQLAAFLPDLNALRKLISGSITTGNDAIKGFQRFIEEIRPRMFGL